MKKVIARVKLNPGQGGYFDPITRIHLTHGDPERDIYAGMNTEGLRAAVRSKRISLVSGSLGNFVAPFKLIKNADGKIVLVENKKKSVPVNKDVAEAKKKISVQQQQSDKTEKVIVTEKPVVQESVVTKNKKIPDDQEIPSPFLPVENNPIVEETIPVTVTEENKVSEESKKDDITDVSYSKKNKKNKKSKEENKASE